MTVRLHDGAVVDGDLRPSTDTEIHRCLYLAFPSIGGVNHTHSTHPVPLPGARPELTLLVNTHAHTLHRPRSRTP